MTYAAHDLENYLTRYKNASERDGVAPTADESIAATLTAALIVATDTVAHHLASISSPTPRMIKKLRENALRGAARGLMAEMARTVAATMLNGGMNGDAVRCPMKTGWVRFVELMRERMPDLAPLEHDEYTSRAEAEACPKTTADRWIAIPAHAAFLCRVYLNEVCASDDAPAPFSDRWARINNGTAIEFNRLTQYTIQIFVDQLKALAGEAKIVAAFGGEIYGGAD